MNDKWMRSFLTVAKEGSITAASNKLYISTQALVQQINLMEDELQFKLFNRTHSGVHLTAAGEAFLKGVERISSLYEGTLSQCIKLSRLENSIRIPMMNTIVYPRYMENICSIYRQRYPEQMPPLLVSDNAYNERPHDILAGKYDIAEWFFPENVEIEGLYFEAISKVENVCLMAENNKLASNKILHMKDLNNCRIIIPEASGNLFIDLINHIETGNINLEFARVNNHRYDITDEMDKQGIYLTDSTISSEFSGYVSIPLIVHSNIVRGLVCREDEKDNYEDFFTIAKEVWQQLYGSTD